MTQSDATPPPHDRAAANEDHTLARQIAGGDLSAFERLMRRHNRRLYRLARATLGNDSDAEDAVQESYLRAYRSIGQFRGDASLLTWLARIVLNECLARQRREARRENVIPITASLSDLDADTLPDSRTEAPDEALMRTELRKLLESKLDQLPSAFRTVFMMRAVEEMSVEEVADVLGIAEATVRSRHFRARSLLRESLASEIDLAERDAFEFAGERCDRIVAAVLSKLRDDDRLDDRPLDPAHR